MFVWKKPIKSMIYLEDVNINELTKYKINSVSDIGKVDEITNMLPGIISRTGTGLVWNNEANVQVGYSYYGGNKIELKRLERYWKDNREKILLFNATTYLILIPNVQKVTIALDVPYKQKFEVTRKDLEKFYGNDLNEYFTNTSLWEKEVLKETINSSHKLKPFFKLIK